MHEIVEKFYRIYYSQVFDSQNLTSFASYAYQTTHKKLEKSFDKRTTFEKVIEIGAGKGEHLKFIKHNFNEYVSSDLIPYESDQFDKRVRNMSFNATDIPFPDKYFDRSLMMCVLHHVKDVYKVLEEIKRVTKPGGVISIFLPHDPMFANRLNRRIFVTPKAKRLGFQEYEFVNALEHSNHYHSILIQTRYLFSGNRIKVNQYPFRIKFPSINLFSIIEIYT
jgi:ubiquinone/menaquinone biosynthesis C-methylase UbiE